MKKALAFTVSLLLALALLAGCGGTASEPQDTSAPAGSTSTATANTFDAANAITVVSREDGSGTRSAFVELTGVEVKDDDGNKTDMTTLEAAFVSSTSVVMTTVSGDPYAIGYISLGSLNDTVKAIQIDGVAPSTQTVKDGSYAISRPFNIATKDGLSEAAQDFIDYIMSSEGQAIVEENGYIAVADSAEAYAGSAPEGKVVVAGSSSVTPVMEKLAEAYAAVNPNANVEIQQSDSSTGMSAAIDGLCDIGMASRELKDSELEAGLTPTVIAMDGIAVIVNSQNPTASLTMEQVRAIFTGETTTWEGLA